MAKAISPTAAGITMAVAMSAQLSEQASIARSLVFCRLTRWPGLCRTVTSCTLEGLGFRPQLRRHHHHTALGHKSLGGQLLQMPSVSQHRCIVISLPPSSDRPPL